MNLQVVGPKKYGYAATKSSKCVKPSFSQDTASIKWTIEVHLTRRLYLSKQYIK